MKKDFITLKDFGPQEIEELFVLSDELKADKAKFIRALAGKSIALIFQKPSNRTRVSFEVGMYQLGGNSIYLAPDEINLGVRESIKDVARTLSRYVDGIVLRTFQHKNIVEMAEFATIPVINGLSDFSHPCQALADVYTVRERLKNLAGLKFAYVGDGNNVCTSLLHICPKVGMDIHVASPKGYEPPAAVVREAVKLAKPNNSSVKLFKDAAGAVKGADVIYTDVWASMGEEKEAKERKKRFKAFQVNLKLLKEAKKNALVMHCLPAHRGEEITDEVMESPNSVIFDQAENRMHVQKAVLLKLLE